MRPDPLRTMDEWLAPYRRMWASRLEDLERHLDEMPEGEDRGEGADDVRNARTAR
jgi:hypothetical protein